MILTDVMPLAKERKWTNKRLNQPEVKKSLKLKEDYSAANRLAHFIRTNEEKYALRKVNERIKDEFDQLRMKLFRREFSLPETLKIENQEDVLFKAASTPKIQLKDVRELADLLGFCVIPFEYLDQRSFKDEPSNVRALISNFKKKLDPWFDIYVLAPTHHYNVDQHIRSKSDLPIYAGTPVAQAFMAVDMSIPIFRAMYDKMSTLDQKMTNLGMDIASLQKKVVILQTQVEQVRQQQIIEAQRAAKRKQELEKLARERAFWAYEPVMIALPKDVTISDDSLAIIGPCWGPDFPDIVMAALKLKRVDGQRKMLATTARNNWGEGITRYPRF